MNRLFQDNYVKLRGTLPGLLFENEKYDLESQEYYSYEKDSKIWMLQSRFDMDKAVSAWCGQFEEISYLNIFMIFGFGDARYIREMMRRYPDNVIIIYEPCEEILAQQMCQDDLSDVIQAENVIIIAGAKKRFVFECVFQNYIGYANLDNLVYVVLPNYIKMFEEEYEEYVLQLKELVQREVMARNTKIIREEYRGKNYLYNLEKFWMEASVRELGKAIHNAGKGDCPAVLISAGPSLDKNIEVLKEYQDRVFILCVDAAIPVAYRHGIKPDLLMTQDPKFKDATVFDNQYGKSVPLIASITSDIDIVKRNKGRKFYIYEEQYYIDNLLEKYNCEMYGLRTGGSVANTAFSFLEFFGGFKNIILIGQDLGYPDNRFHATGVFEDEGRLDAEDDDRYFYVESIDGNKVLTEENMNLYRLWFENRITDNEKLNVIDATEGGALIHGTTVMTLEEALKTYALPEKIEFEQLIQDAEYLLSDENKKEVQNKIDRSYNGIEEIIQKLEAQKKVYDKLDKLNRNGKYTTKEFKRCIDEVGKFHTYIQDDPDIDLVRVYTNRGEYIAMEELQAKESNVYDEIKLVVDSGRKLLQAYIEGAEKLKREWTSVRTMQED